ncbi:MAG: fumarate hydratase [Caldilineaceae bacterium]|uniref:Fumarate hydratase n=1 Tax=Caldilineaceae bacterium SB0675_bin_29 TaxID=2605266 RepID=A0A6B1G0W2_9CHLR|nr:fumarate hydratase [Caldilineaceae bacterium]MYH61066.1 fumarate hydratase [Caldilineaceae bacterium SB0675_bin_29]
MRKIDVGDVRRSVGELLRHSAHSLPEDYLEAMRTARQEELSPTGQDVIELLLDNAAYAETETIPTCQDTGMAILFVEVGQEVHFSGGGIEAALQDATRDAYADLRKSVVSDPLLRVNSGDNTPALIHWEIVAGDGLRISTLQKGFGAELMSRVQMFPPAVGEEGLQQFVLDTIESAGPNACPPLIVGVGIGGSLDTVGLAAKKALLRPIGGQNPEPHVAKLEAEMLEAINRLGIGPQGLGGVVTALAVHVEVLATHIAALPIAVNLNCSAPRRATLEL